MVILVISSIHFWMIQLHPSILRNVQEKQTLIPDLSFSDIPLPIFHQLEGNIFLPLLMCKEYRFHSFFLPRMIFSPVLDGMAADSGWG